MDSHGDRQAATCVPDSALKAIAEEQFPPRQDGVTYLNTGSNGVKPRSVIEAINEGLKQLNANPTILTFLDPQPLTRARQLAAQLFAIDASNLLLTGNTTQGLQLIMESFLLKAGDELITTNHEHGSSKTIMRYLEETRGVVVKKHEFSSRFSSEEHCMSLLSLVNPRTKLVLVSEVDCFTGWRPDLNTLVDGLEMLDIPLLVDGAHSPGHIFTKPSQYPMWVGSGHKWLGGPNGTGFAYVKKDLIPLLEPVWLGDGFYEQRDQEIYDITRFECRGTSDVCQWFGLSAALELQLRLNMDDVLRYQRLLVERLRNKLLERFPVTMRTPGPEDVPADERTAIVGFYFEEERLRVPDLRAALWADHKLWIQPDFLSATPGRGARVCCHYNVNPSDIDRLIEALADYVC